MTEFITDEEQEMLLEMRRLLDEAYDHYFEFSDGYCKSSEGYFALNFDTYFDRRDGYKKPIGVEVFSYVFGSNRHHYFDNISQALEEVKRWHEVEMNDEHEE